MQVRRQASLDVEVGGVGLGVHGREAAAECGDGGRVDYREGWRRHDCPSWLWIAVGGARGRREGSWKTTASVVEMMRLLAAKGIAFSRVRIGSWR